MAALVDECRAANVPAELIINGEPIDLSPQAELTLYRAAQEGLTNVRKHARASRATVTLEYYGAHAVRLVIEDNGVGGDASNGGFGLLGVRERAQLLGGSVRVRSVPNEGFVLEVELPVPSS